ncbi:type II toxin-antitoxin system VapC family toxin [Candidatus Microgenomates bacterium]|nr:type II toxin-antitoxin system VapC family toxin [Candidatus Microgenomates bacterium]
MRKCYLDANLLFYWQDPESPFNEAATDIIKRLVESEYFLFTSSLILDEYLYTCLKFSGKPKSDMKSSLKLSLRKIFKLPHLQLINPTLDEKKHLGVIDLIVRYNLRPRDAYHVFIMRENKMKFIATFDTDFEKVFARGVVKHFV